MAFCLAMIFAAFPARASVMSIDYTTGSWSWTFNSEEEVLIGGIEAQWGTPAASGASALFSLSATATKDSISAEWTGRAASVGIYFENGDVADAVISVSSVILYLEDIPSEEANGLVLSDIVITPTSSFAALFATYEANGNIFAETAGPLGALAPATNSSITIETTGAIPPVPEPGRVLLTAAGIAVLMARRRPKFPRATG